jgi:2-alkyl-3-oxoalkanoate reductase
VNIALTGATGGFGMAFALRARARGDRVRALVRDPERARALADHGVELVRGDLSDARALAEVATGAEVFVHAAALMGRSGDPAAFERVNVAGTRAALEAAGRAAAKRFVHLSSVAVYGRPSEGVVDETWPAQARGSAYEHTKYAAERLVFARGPELGMTVVAVRPAHIIGVHDRSFVPHVLKMLERRMMMYVDSEATTNIVDVDDVVEVVLRCAELPQAAGEVFNVAAAPIPTIREVMETIADAAALPRPWLHLSAGTMRRAAWCIEHAWRIARLGHPPITVSDVQHLTHRVRYDASKARRVLGWDGGREPLAMLRRVVRTMTPASPS